ncbi:MAG TPA: hypothetical protein VIL72_01710 [Beijerinckiaceae bacterium]|jgi:hypothetical protein
MTYDATTRAPAAALEGSTRPPEQVVADRPPPRPAARAGEWRDPRALVSRVPDFADEEERFEAALRDNIGVAIASTFAVGFLAGWMASAWFGRSGGAPETYRATGPAGSGDSPKPHGDRFGRLMRRG